jgi:hypothetical protein
VELHDAEHREAREKWKEAATMNLRDLEREVYRFTNKKVSTPNPETQDRVRGNINRRHRMLLREFPGLRDDILTFDSVADQQDYALPEQGIARINRIFETTNDIKLERQSLAWLRAHDVDPQSGVPVAWVPLSYAQVHTQPEDASSVFIKSTSASDVGRAFIEGIVDGGDRRKAEVTMTGTTAVDVDTTTTTWVQIDKVYLDTAAVGTVTLHEDSGSGTELSHVAIGDTYAKYLAFLLWPTPSDAVTFYCDVTRGIADMVNPLDEPLLPEDFHDLLSIGARLDEYEHVDDVARRRIAEVEWDEGVKALTSWLVAHPDVCIDLNAEVSRGAGRSRLGSWFPAGS